MTYLLDANVFIEAKNRYYAFDICPGFWTWLDAAGASGMVATIAPVRDELIAGRDELADWMRARRDAAWVADVRDHDTQRCFREVAAAVQAGPWSSQGKAHFLSGADPWLVAKAMAMDATVVTHETFSAEARRRVPLPNLCAEFGRPFVNTFDVLRRLAGSFVLAA